MTGFGRVVIIATMFLGRVGPLALLGAVIFSHDLLRLDGESEIRNLPS